MDPDAALTNLRRAMADLDVLGLVVNDEESMARGWPSRIALETARAVHASFTDLDRWLTGGGVLPGRWRAGRGPGRAGVVEELRAHARSGRHVGDTQVVPLRTAIDIVTGGGS